MNTKNRYIQPIVEIIEIEVETSVMTGSDISISNEEINANDGPMRSKRNFWKDNE